MFNVSKVALSIYKVMEIVISKMNYSTECLKMGWYWHFSLETPTMF